MEKSSKKFYWAVTGEKGVIFGGTFTECWHYLTGKYCNYTMRQLVEKGIRISRANG